MNYEYTNIVPKEKLREVQSNTLEVLADVLSKTAGPKGSNTQLLHSQRNNEYTKDGHNVLSDIKFYRPLENAIQTEMKEMTRYIVKTVGDGTTSVVLLSNAIFKSMCAIEGVEMSAYEIMDRFKNIVEEMIEKIKEESRECTLDDIYDICMIATNGNKDVSNAIQEIYKDYGMDVFIDVGISNTTDHLVKVYDGLTLNVGFPTPAYINTKDNERDQGRCIIRNPKIYAFEDPVDTPEMIAFLDKILYDNTLKPLVEGTGTCVPTVILAPSISRDANKMLLELEKTLYSFDKVGQDKPPVLIITEANVHKEQFNDILLLCDVPTIRKFINPDVQQKAIENGDAPTVETVLDWCGFADMVESDANNTKFVNPKCMFETDENGERKTSSVYNGILNHIQQELDLAIKNGEDANVTGKLKRRLNSLKTNLVEYLIGGITVTDRDSVRDLVEDAVLNCRSAAKHGVGYGANFEGFKAITKIIEKYYDGKYEEDSTDDEIQELLNTDNDPIAIAIYRAYLSVLRNLYGTSMGVDRVDEFINESITQEMPVNLVTLEFDGKVLCSIETDIAILQAISKVLMVMFTANQALIENPMNNVYLGDN